MKIFDKRPLSLILCIMLGTFVLFSFYDILAIRITLLLSILTLFILSFITPVKKRFNVIFMRVYAICACVTILFSFIYFDLWFKAHDRYEGEVTVIARVEDIKPSSYNNAIYLKTDRVNDTPFSEYNLILYLDKNEYYGFSIGSKVKLTGVIEAFTNEQNFDAESYYTARGISGVINNISCFEITDIGSYPLSYKITDFRESICRRIIYASNKDVGGLLCALLLGEKDYLPIGTKLDFSRIGISHILALSGMHLAILAIGFSRLLKFFKVGKKPATLFTIIFTLLYMTLTGFSVSVTRAGIMLIVSSLLFLLSQTHDSMTSLFIAVSIICIIEPYSIFDISLWLSAFATLGIVVMTEYHNEKYKKASFLNWLFTSFTSSFFAIAATFAITIIKFDGISLLAPIATLIFSVLTEIFIYIGLLLIFLGNIIPIKYIFIPIGNLIINLSNWLSDINWIYVSTNFTLVIILSIIFSIFFFLFFILKIKRKKEAVVSLVILLMLIFSTSAFLTYDKEHNASLTYNNDEYEHLIITQRNEICIIDICTYKRSTAYSTYANLADKNLTRIDKYFITHYSYYLEEALDTLIETILVKEIYMPIPQNKTEERILFDIKEFASSAGIDINVYENEQAINIGEFSIIPLYSYMLGEERKNMLSILYKDNFYTYLSVDMLTGKTKNMALEVIEGSHTIIFGHHESGSAEYKFTYEFDNVDTVIFSSNRIVLNDNAVKYYSSKNVYFSPKGVSLIR